MKKILMLIISFINVAYARASEFLFAQIEKKQIKIIDQKSLQIIKHLQDSGSVEIQLKEDGGVNLIIQKDAQGQYLFESLLQNGIITQKETASGSDCVGFCIKP